MTSIAEVHSMEHEKWNQNKYENFINLFGRVLGFILVYIHKF